MTGPISVKPKIALQIKEYIFSYLGKKNANVLHAWVFETERGCFL